MKEQTLSEQLQTKDGRVNWIEDQAIRWGFSIELNQATLFALNDSYVKNKKAFLENLIKRVKKFDILKKTQFFWALEALLKQYTEKGENKKVEELVKNFKELTHEAKIS